MQYCNTEIQYYHKSIVQYFNTSSDSEGGGHFSALHICIGLQLNKCSVQLHRTVPASPMIMDPLKTDYLLSAQSTLVIGVMSTAALRAINTSLNNICDMLYHQRQGRDGFHLLYLFVCLSVSRNKQGH